MTRPAIPSSRPAPARVPPRFPAWLLPVLLALGTLALYWPALHCGFINMDDPEYVTANPRVQAGWSWASVKWFFSHPVVYNWHPLTMLSHMLDCQLFGLQPWGPHLVNVLLHAANAALVFLWLRRLTGAAWRSLAVAALFAVHPLHVESVAWIAERKDVLSAFFFLLTLICYTRYAQKLGDGRSEMGVGSKPAEGEMQKLEGRNLSSISYLPSAICYLLSLFCFALGLMCKPMLVTLPFVLLLLDYWPLQRFQVSGFKFQVSSFRVPLSAFRFLILEKIPFFVLAAAAGLITLIVQQRSGAVGANNSLPLAARAGNALVSYCRYLGKTFWPSHLAIYYPHPGWWPPGRVLLAGLLLLGLTVLILAGRRRCPFVLMGWLWFGGMLLPVIGLTQSGWQAMADRYDYLPSLGLLVPLVWGAYEATRRWRHQTAILAAAGSLAVAACLLLTHRQLGFWRDSVSVFRHALAVTDNNYFAHENLGLALLDRGELDAAIAQFQPILRYAPTHYNLGLALALKGRTAEAISQFQEAVRLDPDNAPARFNLAIALLKTGQPADAIAQLQEVVRLQPDNADAHFNLGTALGQQGRLADAILQLQAVVRLQPGNTDARNNLGVALFNAGQPAAAIAQFQEIVRLRPDDAAARRQLANALSLTNAPPDHP